MGSTHKRKFIKCDHKKVNITATFGSEMVLEGATAIPNLLLKMYKRIGITDFQMMLLVQLVRFNIEEGELLPKPEALAEFMEADPARIKNELSDLLQKEIITVSDYHDREQNQVIKGYDFELLFLKVSDVWATSRFKEIEESQKIIAADKLPANRRVSGDYAFDLISVFENEFGRPLSPMEVEQINQWAAEGDPQLVLEALKRAVLRGKHNFKYINSILFEWRKNNLRTLEAIADYDQEFLSRRSKKADKSSIAGTSPDSPGSKSDSKKKAFIRSLYAKC